MGLKEPPLWSQRSCDRRHLSVLRLGWERLQRFHGQVQGMFSGDEFLHGVGSTQGTELCTVVELLSSLQTALRIGGESWIASAIERIAYNALPAMLTADHRAHQYFQQPNQVECSPGARGFSVQHDTDLLFGVCTGYGCCAANFHMGWPRFAQHLWMATPDNGLAAMIFAPCEVQAEVAGGARVRIVEETAYPFADEVRLTIECDGSVRFPLSLHLPAWVREASIELNGGGREHLSPLGDGIGWWRREREWCDGDVLTLHMLMPIVASRWERSSVAVERGPLVYALAVGEEWRSVAGSEPYFDYEVHPTTPWNYALAIDPHAPAIEAHPRPMAAQPWARDGAPLFLTAPARPVPSWQIENGSAGPIPQPPVAADGRVESVQLIPYGCARLRIAMFPVVQGVKGLGG
jgi:hypothetical protein